MNSINNQFWNDSFDQGCKQYRDQVSPDVRNTVWDKLVAPMGRQVMNDARNAVYNEFSTQS